MSNYCAGCRYEPGRAVGEGACPFTTLYWDFLQRHRVRFTDHPRAGMQWRNLDRLDAATVAQIQAQAERLRASLTETGPTLRGPTSGASPPRKPRDVLSSGVSLPFEE
jgi:deoxyribodipyrimidine photolyase-related protein